MPILEIEKLLLSDLCGEIDGLSFHISGNDDINQLFSVLDRAEKILQKITNKELILNIGGGFKIEVKEDFFHKLNDRLIEMKTKFNIRILCEPGQYIVKKSGVIIARVIGVHEQNNVFNVFIDAGFPTGIHRKPEYIKLFNNKRKPDSDKKLKIYRFYDNTCMYQELFTAPLRFLLYEDDLIELGFFGSYSICKCNNFHIWKKPELEYCVNDFKNYLTVRYQNK